MSVPPSAGARGLIEDLLRAAKRGSYAVCLDSAPLIDYIALHEPVATLLQPLFESTEVSIIISVVSLAEAVGRPAMAGDDERVETIHRALLAMPNLKIIDFDQRHAIEAASVRGLAGLRLPDAIVVATARLAGSGALIGNDRQWLKKSLRVPYHHIDDILALP